MIKFHSWSERSQNWLSELRLLCYIEGVVMAGCMQISTTYVIKEVLQWLSLKPRRVAYVVVLPRLVGLAPLMETIDSTQQPLYSVLTSRQSFSRLIMRRQFTIAKQMVLASVVVCLNWGLNQWTKKMGVDVWSMGKSHSVSIGSRAIQRETQC